MKKLYTIGIALSMVAFGTQSIAQVSKLKAEAPTLIKSVASTSTKVKAIASHLAKGDTDVEVYWSEDFSNGFDGQDDNGAWTVSEDQGSLWFYTFPIGSTNGYTPDGAILGGTDPEYGTKIPNYFGEDVCNSETRDNGVMMIDPDRFNSSSTEESPLPAGEATLENPVTAHLVSPSFSLPDLETGALTFFTNGRCFSTTALTADISIDGGDNWLPLDIYSYVDGASNALFESQITFNISDILAGADDQSDMKVRFVWGGMTHYFWTIDDVAITSLAANDLSVGESWTNNYFDLESSVFAEENATPASEFFASFEYYNQPEYYTRPYNFGMEVSNVGANTQTGVTLSVTGTAPSGATYTWPFDPIELEAGVLDTLRITNALLTDIGPLETGQYTFDFAVSQDQIDVNPANNVGNSRQSTISNESDNDGFAIMRNDANSYQGAYITAGQDRIWATSYVFPELSDGSEAKYITHVETVFLFSAGFAETIAGELVYFNVRKNHPFETVDGEPDTESTVFFGNDNLTYDDQELEFTIQESDIWQSTAGLPFVWASFELPTPILIEPGIVYSAEYRIPAAGGNIVFSPVTSESEGFSSISYVFGDGNWVYLGDPGDQYSFNAMPIRFRTATPIVDSVDDITYDGGLTLVQNYPNPMTESTKIQYSVEESTTATLEVRDITGKMVFTRDLGTLAANVPQTYELQRGDLAPGVYTYSLVTPEFQVSRKLTVQ